MNKGAVVKAATKDRSPIHKAGKIKSYNLDNIGMGVELLHTKNDVVHHMYTRVLSKYAATMKLSSYINVYHK